MDNVIRMQKNKYDLVLRRYQEEINSLKETIDKQSKVKESSHSHQIQAQEVQSTELRALQYQLQLKNQLLEKYEDQNQNLKKQNNDMSSCQDDQPSRISRSPKSLRDDLSYKQYRQMNTSLSKSRSFVRLADTQYSSPVKMTGFRQHNNQESSQGESNQSGFNVNNQTRDSHNSL